MRPELISTAIRAALGSYDSDVDAGEAGRVITIGDGIARVSGLESAMLGEMLAFGEEVRHPRDGDESGHGSVKVRRLFGSAATATPFSRIGDLSLWRSESGPGTRRRTGKS
jgi:hypothetical protein